MNTVFKMPANNRIYYKFISHPLEFQSLNRSISMQAYLNFNVCSKLFFVVAVYTDSKMIERNTALLIWAGDSDSSAYCQYNFRGVEKWFYCHSLKLNILLSQRYKIYGIYFKNTSFKWKLDFLIFKSHYKCCYFISSYSSCGQACWLHDLPW